MAKLAVTIKGRALEKQDGACQLQDVFGDRLFVPKHLGSSKLWLLCCLTVLGVSRGISSVLLEGLFAIRTCVFKMLRCGSMFAFLGIKRSNDQKHHTLQRDQVCLAKFCVIIHHQATKCGFIEVFLLMWAGHCAPRMWCSKGCVNHVCTAKAVKLEMVF